jgi:hypothetical protein
MSSDVVFVLCDDGSVVGEYRTLRENLSTNCVTE